MSTTKIVPGDARIDVKCAASSVAEPALHNFGTVWSILPDASLTILRNRHPAAGKRFHNGGEVQIAMTSWFQTLAVDFYNTGMQTLVHPYDKCLDNCGDYVEK